MGAVDIIADVAGLVIPGVPSAGIKAGVKAVDAAHDAYKAADALHDASKVADATKTIVKNGDNILDAADAAKDLKKASNIADAGKDSSKALTSSKKLSGNIPSSNTKVIRNSEVKSNRQVKCSQVTDVWDDYLGPNQTNIHPIKKIADPDRIFSADGTRSIRFGKHEMNSFGTNKAHFHQERWIYDSTTDVMNYHNTLIRIKR